MLLPRPGSQRRAHILDSLAGTKRFNRWMADTIRPWLGTRVLELGAGIGNMTQQLAGGRKRYVASDIDQGEEPALVERDDGSWLVSGAASADLLTDRLGVSLPQERDYSTVAGFALSVLKHLPEIGEKFRHDGWSFEIVDLDGRKIDKLIASRTRKRQTEAQAEAVG